MAEYSTAQTIDALVLIHGSGDSARCWKGVRARLGTPTVRTIALDLPGHGANADKPLLAPTVAAHAKWVRDHLSSAQINRAVIAGHSLGSAVALRLALDDPSLVAHAVLIGSGARLRVLPALLESAHSDLAATMAQLVTMGHAPANAELARGYLATLAPTAPGALANDLTACDAFDVTGELAALRVAVTIVVGEQDRLTPTKYAQYLADHIARAQLRVVPAAGHYLMDEAPAAVADALRERLP